MLLEGGEEGRREGSQRGEMSMRLGWEELMGAESVWLLMVGRDKVFSSNSNFAFSSSLSLHLELNPSVTFVPFYTSLVVVSYLSSALVVVVSVSL